MSKQSQPGQSESDVSAAVEASGRQSRFAGPAVHAVVELGTSAIRMAVGEVIPGRPVRVLDKLVRGISLGKDTFRGGEIRRDTMLRAIDVLRSYRRKLREYQCTDGRSIRVVATSAVREASNRVDFLDRIYTSTGFEVETIDDAEIARLTYLGMMPYLQSSDELREAPVLIMEVGGGNTEVLLLQAGEVLHSRSYRFGSLRIRQSVRQFEAGREHAQELIAGQIRRMAEQITDHLPRLPKTHLLALGSDIRFAARQMQLEPEPNGVTRMPLRLLKGFVASLRTATTDDLARRFHIDLNQAETLLPALWFTTHMAESLSVTDVLLSPFNLRDGIMQHMSESGDWSDDLRSQIEHSARSLAVRFDVDMDYAVHVAELARTIFIALRPQHGLDDRWQTILYAGAVLHECGLFVGPGAYHKHSEYLISNSELFGVSSREMKLIAMVARYHRRASPKATHDSFRSLQRHDRVSIKRMAGILRLAIGLNQSRNQAISSIRCVVERKRMIIHVDGSAADLTLEQMLVRQAAGLFEDSFGLRVLLRGRRTIGS